MVFNLDCPTCQIGSDQISFYLQIINELQMGDAFENAENGAASESWLSTFLVQRDIIEAYLAVACTSQEQIKVLLRHDPSI